MAKNVFSLFRFVSGCRRQVVSMTGAAILCLGAQTCLAAAPQPMSYHFVGWKNGNIAVFDSPAGKAFKLATGTWVYVSKSGSVSYRFPDGSVGFKQADGSVKRVYPNGKSDIYHAVASTNSKTKKGSTQVSPAGVKNQSFQSAGHHQSVNAPRPSGTSLQSRSAQPIPNRHVSSSGTSNQSQMTSTGAVRRTSTPSSQIHSAGSRSSNLAAALRAMNHFAKTTTPQTHQNSVNVPSGTSAADTGQTSDATSGQQTSDNLSPTVSGDSTSATANDGSLAFANSLGSTVSTQAADPNSTDSANTSSADANNQSLDVDQHGSDGLSSNVVTSDQTSVDSLLADPATTDQNGLTAANSSDGNTGLDFGGVGAANSNLAVDNGSSSTGFDSGNSSGFDSSGYDANNVDSSSSGASNYDSGSYDSSGNDNSSYDNSSYDNSSYDSGNYDSGNYDSGSYDSGN